MNKLDFTKTLMVRIHLSEIGYVQFLALVCLSRLKNQATSADLSAMSGISNVSMILSQIEKYINKSEKKKIDGKWKHLYSINDKGIELIREMLK